MERTHTRSAGPYNPNETGPVAGERVIEKGTVVFIGTRSKTVDRDIYLNEPLDKGEVGTAFNGYKYNED
jgi:hypothetical protein